MVATEQHNILREAKVSTTGHTCPVNTLASDYQHTLDVQNFGAPLVYTYASLIVVWWQG